MAKHLHLQQLEDTGKPVSIFTNTVLALKESSQSILFRAVASFFVTRGHYCKCQRHKPCRGVWGILLQNIFRFGGSEMLFSALVMRYVSKKLTSKRCEKACVFSAYKCLFPRSCQFETQGISKH